MSALGRFGRFTLFSPRVSHSNTCRLLSFVCFVFLFVVFLFPVLQVFGIPNSPRSLDLDDRQGFIASSAMQQKKKRVSQAQFLCIECAQLSGTTHPPECRSCRMQISPLTSFSVPLQDSIQTCEILGLMEGGSCVPLMPPVGIQGIGV